VYVLRVVSRGANVCMSLFMYDQLILKSSHSACLTTRALGEHIASTTAEQSHQRCQDVCRNDPLNTFPSPYTLPCHIWWLHFNCFMYLQSMWLSHRHRAWFLPANAIIACQYPYQKRDQILNSVGQNCYQYFSDKSILYYNISVINIRQRRHKNSQKRQQQEIPLLCQNK